MTQNNFGGAHYNLLMLRSGWSDQARYLRPPHTQKRFQNINLGVVDNITDVLAIFWRFTFDQVYTSNRHTVHYYRILLFNAYRLSHPFKNNLACSKKISACWDCAP